MEDKSLGSILELPFVCGPLVQVIWNDRILSVDARGSRSPVTQLRNRHDCELPRTSRNSDWTLYVRSGVLQDFRAAGGRWPVSLQSLQTAVGDRVLNSNVRAA